MTMTFLNLKDAFIPNYMLRTDQPFIAQLDDIIQQGMIRIYNSAKDIGFEQCINIPLLQNAFQIAKPAGWRETISFAITDANNNKTFLQERTYEYCKTYLPNPNLSNNPPKYYYDIPINNIVIGSSYFYWQITPIADQNYTINVIYLGLPVFNRQNPINFLTLRYPNLLLYSCLLEASLFLNNEEQRSKYEMMFAKELELINNMNINRTTDRTTVRDKS